jgi:hypothetical protein
MNSANSAAWKHTVKYSAESSCEHCDGVIRHEPWCLTVNESVLYAYTILLDPGKLTLEDRLILHALGVAWSNNSRTVRRVGQHR